MTLAELERYFAAVATSTSGPPADLDTVFKASPRLPPSALLGVYNRGYHYRLLGALSSVFARTKHALGDAEFERLGLQYLARHPSEHPAVERVGRLFPQYLTTEVSAKITDLAALEWARLAALVSPDPSSIALASSIEVTEFPSSRLCFVPSLSVVSLDARTLALFPGTSGSISAGVGADFETEPRGVAVWRKRHVVIHQALGSSEHAVLSLALAGASVAHFCALFDSGAAEDDAARAFRTVSAWFSREWIERSEVLAP